MERISDEKEMKDEDERVELRETEQIDFKPFYFVFPFPQLFIRLRIVRGDAPKAANYLRTQDAERKKHQQTVIPFICTRVIIIIHVALCWGDAYVRSHSNADSFCEKQFRAANSDSRQSDSASMRRVNGF